MSMIVTLAQEAGTQLHLADAHHSMSVTLAAGDGLLDWATTKNAATQVLFRGVSVTVAIIFVIWQAISSRMVMARIIISVITAGVLVWGVWNITSLKDRVDKEVNGLAAVVHTAGGGAAGSRA